MSDLLNPQVEALIEKLDPFRDYGPRTYQQVVEEVRTGKLFLRDTGGVLPQPYVTDAITGYRVKGSALPPKAAGSGGSQFYRRLFKERGEQDFNEVYTTLLEACRRLDSRAIKIWMQYFIGDPERVAFEGASEEALKLMTKMLEAGHSTSREVVIDTTGRAVDN